MEVYPPEFINHDCPFIMVSGLGEDVSESEAKRPWLFDHSLKVESALPPVELPEGKKLLNILLDTGFYGLWPRKTEKLVKGTVTPVFRVKAVGRNIEFPSRKAKPPPGGLPSHPDDQSLVRTLHSELSPLSPQSPVFPDGVITHWWLRKYSDFVPCAFVSFYEVLTRGRDPKQAASQDNLIINSINNLKKVMTISSTFSSTSSANDPSTRRTKLVVVLMSELSNAEAPGLDDRIQHIRRMTNMDPKSNFFVVQAHSSSAELSEFARYLGVSLLPSALEFYRELSKHARKKKGRGSIPLPTVAPTTTSQVLSTAGWAIRYEFKLGVFAETRNEMDIASKHYEAAYEGVINEIFTATSEWSERWKEARLLIDMLAFRVARCALWMGNCAFAVRRWTLHIGTTRDILEKRGKGIETYGYAAWLSNWYKLFAELVKAANIQRFETSIPSVSTGLPPAAPTIYAPFEATMPSKEKIYPHYRLHHPGFYYMYAADYMNQRQLRADNTDDSDPQDTYLCGDIKTEREVNHAERQIDLLRNAIFEFESRQQIRMANSIRMKVTDLLMRQAESTNDEELWKECSRSLSIVARKYRSDRWIRQLDDTLQRRLKCARQSKDSPVILATELELQDSRFSSSGQDLRNCLKGYHTSTDKTALVLRGEDFVNFLDTSYAFAGPETHVGEYACSQLAITSRANPSSKPVAFTEIKVAFEGNIKSISLQHKEGSSEDCSENLSENYTIVNLKGKCSEQHSLTTPPPTPSAPRNAHMVEADLTLSPGQTKVFEIYTMLREAGDAKAKTVTFCMETDEFDLEILHELEYELYPFSDELGMGNIVGNGSRRSGKTGKEVTLDGGNGAWYVAKDGKAIRTPIRAMEPGAVKILPKPPKMEITVQKLDIPAFVNEHLTVEFTVENEEDEPAETTLSVEILGYDDIAVKWLNVPEGPQLSSLPLGRIEEGSKRTGAFSFTTLPEATNCKVEISAHYRLISDPKTPVSKTIYIDLPVINPFATAFNFSPRVHLDKWPSYFTMETPAEIDGEKVVEGLVQRWCLTTNISNQTPEPISIVGHRLELEVVYGDVICKVVEGDVNEGDVDIDMTSVVPIPFTIDIQRSSFDDRKPLQIAPFLTIYWKRAGSSRTNMTRMPVPILPIPAAEPRLLATIRRPEEIPNTLELNYTLENPTIYFLTFSITMEGSDVFAFGGPKQIVLQILPLSRHTFKYNLLPINADPEGEWIKPVVKVVDRYFAKTLRCSPADDETRMKLAPGGESILIWTGEKPEQVVQAEKSE